MVKKWERPVPSWLKTPIIYPIENEYCDKVILHLNDITGFMKITPFTESLVIKWPWQSTFPNKVLVYKIIYPSDVHSPQP